MNAHATDLIVRQLCDDFTAASKIDYVGFWEIVAAVAKLSPKTHERESADVTFAVSRCLVDRGLRALTFVDGKPSPVFWKASTTDGILDRIRTEWEKLHDKPVGLGDVCWFAAPEGHD